MAKKIIKIELDARQAQRVAQKISKDLDGINRSTKTLSSSFGRLQGVLVGIFSIRAIRAIADYSDQFKLLEARIKIFRKEGESVKEIQSQLLDIAKKNGVQISGIVDAYTKFNNGLKETGLNSSQVLKTLEATTSAFRIFGVAGAQAESAILQLSQGLQKGNLDGEEFKAVSENASILLDLFAKEAGVARGSLKEFASEGKLTSKIIVNALLKNLEKLNSEAEKVPLTFGQIKANLLTSFGEALARLEEKTGVFNSLAKGFKFLAENIDLVGAAILGLATSMIPLLIAQVNALFLAIKANPWGLLATVAVAAATLIITRWDTVSTFFRELWEKVAFYTKKAFLNIERTINESKLRIANGLEKGFLGRISKFFGGKDKVEIFDQKQLEISKNRITEINKELAILEKSRKKANSTVSVKKTGSSASGSGSSFLKTDVPLSKDFNAEKFRKLRLAEKESELRKVNQEFDTGKLSIDQYNQKLSQLETSFDDLASNSNRVINGINSGLLGYANDVGNLTKNISEGIKNTLTGLEDQLVNFITKGKFEFKQFADAIIADLTRIVIRQTITANLARGLAGAFGGATGAPAGSLRSENGNVFSGGGHVQKYALGGVVNRTTLFPMSGGKTGMMGEAGPEAILPLRRGSNGKLGVESSPGKVQVNIINQGGGEVETNERTDGNDRFIDVIVKNTVKRGFSSGSFDKELKSNFNINRAGVI